MPSLNRRKKIIRVSDDTAAQIRGMHPEIKRRIRYGLQEIFANPDAGKSLKDELQGLKSYRVGRFRIIYRVSSDRTIEIVAIGPRKAIYELTLREIRKEGRE